MTRLDTLGVQYNYTYGLILALIRQIQLLGMKAPQFAHGSPKRCLRVPPLTRCGAEKTHLSEHITILVCVYDVDHFLLYF